MNLLTKWGHLFAKPAKADPFPWRGDLVATCAHVLARDAAKRSARTAKGNRTRREQRA